MEPLDPAIKTVWRIKAALGWGIAAFGTFFVEAASPLGIGRDLPLGIMTAVAVVVGILWMAAVPALRHRFWRFELRPEELYLERGIWTRVFTVVPLSRIQHIDVSQDVIERNYDLGRLIVHTAGSRSSQVVLPGLRYDKAESLRNELRDSIVEDAV